jgi:PAS domain S-box-containing protein
MSDFFDKPAGPVDFRAEAESLAAGHPLPPARSKEELLKQLHELQVSQIELEMQGSALAELQLLKDKFEAGLNHYAELYDRAPVSYFSIERSGAISRVNLAAAALLRSARPRLLGRPFEQFLAPASQMHFRRFLQNVFDSGLRQVIEVSLFDELAQVERVRIEANVDTASHACRMVVTELGGAEMRETALRRAFIVFDNIREGVLITDATNRIVSVNPAFTRITGYAAEEAIGRDPGFLSRGAHSPVFYEAMWDSLERTGSWQGELLNRRKDGALFIEWLSITQMRAEDGGVGNYIGVFSDISERKQAELAMRAVRHELDERVAERTGEMLQANQLLHLEIAERERAQVALREAEHFFHTTIDALQDRVLVLDETGIVLHANHACRSFATHDGIGADYLRHCATSSGWTGGAGVELASGIQGVCAGLLGSFALEYAFMDREGRQLWFQARVSCFPGAGPRRVVVAHTDVTGRKRMEADLLQSQAQLRLLALHLETAKEDERKRISRDIHDDLGQNLLALRIDISMLESRTRARHPRLHGRAAAVLANVDTTIRSVRGIMNELRPPVLDLGLQAALEWQIGDFIKRSGIACRLDAPDETLFARIDDGDGAGVGVVLFRIVQEALSNVLRHSQAKSVIIAMRSVGEVLELGIFDDGIGVTPALRDKAQCFGLIGIAERIAALGGDFRIEDYLPGDGCRLRMRIPLPASSSTSPSAPAA